MTEHVGFSPTRQTLRGDATVGRGELSLRAWAQNNNKTISPPSCKKKNIITLDKPSVETAHVSCRRMIRQCCRPSGTFKRSTPRTIEGISGWRFVPGVLPTGATAFSFSAGRVYSLPLSPLYCNSTIADWMSHCLRNRMKSHSKDLVDDIAFRVGFS